MNRFGKIVDGQFIQYSYPIDITTGKRIIVKDEVLYADGWKKVFSDTQFLTPEERRGKKLVQTYTAYGDHYLVVKDTYVEEVVESVEESEQED